MTIHTLLDEHDRVAILERAGRLRAETPPRWGRMDAAQMLQHCAEALAASLGDIHHQPLGKPLFHTRLVKYLVIRVLPFPKNAPTAPELRVASPAVFDAERTRLAAFVRRYANAADPGVSAEHPLFGILAPQEWGELEYKHLDHHLRQFGV
jgi:hypothetical protein